jgi:hypothetical protein
MGKAFVDGMAVAADGMARVPGPVPACPAMSLALRTH